jgi:hypothetical protein
LSRSKPFTDGRSTLTATSRECGATWTASAGARTDLSLAADSCQVYSGVHDNGPPDGEPAPAANRPERRRNSRLVLTVVSGSLGMDVRYDLGDDHRLVGALCPDMKLTLDRRSGRRHRGDPVGGPAA